MSLIDYRHISGVTAELYVAHKLSELGYIVSRPFMTQCEYDLVIDLKRALQTVQIKKASWSYNGPYAYLQCRLSRDKIRLVSDVDLFAFTDNKMVWLVPTEELVGMTSVCLGSTNPDYKPYTKYRAEDWLI